MMTALAILVGVVVALVVLLVVLDFVPPPRRWRW